MILRYRIQLAYFDVKRGASVPSAIKKETFVTKDIYLNKVHIFDSFHFQIYCLKKPSIFFNRRKLCKNSIAYDYYYQNHRYYYNQEYCFRKSCFVWLSFWLLKEDSSSSSCCCCSTVVVVVVIVWHVHIPQLIFERMKHAFSGVSHPRNATCRLHLDVEVIFNTFDDDFDCKNCCNLISSTCFCWFCCCWWWFVSWCNCSWLLQRRRNLMFRHIGPRKCSANEKFETITDAL